MDCLLCTSLYKCRELQRTRTLCCSEARPAQICYEGTTASYKRKKKFPGKKDKNKQNFAQRAVECPNYAEDLTDTAHKIGLLALHFMEFFISLPYNPCLEGYKTSVLEYLLVHGKNTSKYAKNVLEDL